MLILQFFYLSVNWLLHFLHFVFEVLIIFTIIILNYFSGNFPILNLFGLLCFQFAPSFVQYFSAFSFFFFKVIVFEVSFSQASRKVEFFPWRRLNSFLLLVSALLRLFQWFVSFVQSEIFAEFLFVCFISDGQGWVRWYSGCWWLFFFFFVI